MKLSTIFFLVLVSHVDCVIRKPKTHKYPNVTEELDDHTMVEEFRYKLHNFVETVAWKSEFKAWVDAGLLVMNTPLTKLVEVANEVSEHSDYDEWVKELKDRIMTKIQLALVNKWATYTKSLKDQALNAFYAHLKKTKLATPPMDINSGEITEDFYDYTI